ncbi:SPOR domain-containing protein [Herbaspirillum seropedicae]|uniref:SPOR domain-containing protein n=1 Tax=Herbaspirillum seropedicae TaxID=964 RepID=UPI000847EF25|nr:SPOR domain-containing protein [Herbaspirillum seropedicae]AON56659.1 signal peptide protein [Herbaspirillum seropedicae]
MKLKLLFWLLLVGNVILFGLPRGYFGANATERREPQRLAEQLHPELLSVLPANSEKLASQTRSQAPASAPSASAAAPAGADPAAAANAAAPATQPPAAQVAAVTSSCTEVGNFTVADAKRFSEQLASLNLGDRVAQKLTQDVTSHMVYIPPQDGREGAERRIAELRRLGIGDFYVIPDSFPNPALRSGISLGIFRTEEAAKAYVGQLISRGVRSARIIARRSGAGKQVFQLRDLSPEARTALDNIKSAFPDQEIRACSA